MGGGTEAFEDLGRRCEQDDCRRLDFLPFKCDGCLKMFCLAHRTYGAHACPKADHKSRVVVVCDACSTAIEKDAGEAEGDALRRHAQSGRCDPTKKRKPRCPVRGCREQLTFSNTSTCRSCHQKLCLKHRFQDAHTCKPAAAAAVARDKFLLAFEGRMAGENCREKQPQRAPPPPPPPVEAC